MSFPYYYPYFSARQVAPNYNSPLEAELSALRRSQLLQQQNEIQREVLQKQQLINYYRIRQYEDQLRSKQRLDEVLDHDRIEAQLIASKWRQIAYQNQLGEIKQEQHIHQIEKFNDQRNYLEKDNIFKIKTGAEGGSSNRKQIENERAIQQYQQDLLRKIQTNPNQTKKSKSMIQYQTDKNQNNVNELKNRQNINKNIIINKNKLIDNGLGRVSFANPAISNSIKNQNQHTKQQSNLSRKYQTLNVKQQTNKDNNIDLSLIGKSKKRKYSTGIKKMQNKKISSKRQKCKRNMSVHKYNTARNASTSYRTFNTSAINDASSNAMKRIQNRLKLSMIVYKDSKCKNNRHETEHLLNTYEVQVRTRKQIKDKINNHPKILKKHSLVVQSR